MTLLKVVNYFHVHWRSMQAHKNNDFVKCSTNQGWVKLFFLIMGIKGQNMNPYVAVLGFLLLQ